MTLGFAPFTLCLFILPFMLTAARVSILFFLSDSIFLLPGSLVFVSRAKQMHSDCRKVARLMISPFIPFMWREAMLSILFFLICFLFSMSLFPGCLVSVNRAKQMYSDCRKVARLLILPLLAEGVLSSRFRRAGGRLPNFRNPYSCDRLTDFFHSKFCRIV